MLNTSQTAVKGTLQRARAAVDQHRDEAGQGRAPRPRAAQERAPALAGYLSHQDPKIHPTAVPAGLFVFTMAGEKIHAVTRFHLDELYPRFGLAGSWPEPDGGRARTRR